MRRSMLFNKVVIVTGSGMGIGKAIALNFAEHGAKVVLNDRDAIKLQATEQEFIRLGFEVKAVKGDVSSLVDSQYLIEETLEAFGQLDILINNAGIATRGTVEEIIPHVFDALTETNFLGSVYVTKCALPYLRRKKGHIIFINSICGFRGMPYSSVYSSTKMAQAAFAESLRIELHETGIHVGIAYLSFIRNSPKKEILSENGKWTHLPMRKNVRVAEPEEVAAKIRMMIEKRQHRFVHTLLGKATYLLQRFFPNIVDWIFTWKLKEIRDEFSYNGKEPTERPAKTQSHRPDTMKVAEQGNKNTKEHPSR